MEPDTINRVHERIADLVYQVANYAENSRFEKIFATDFGQRLGRQADELLNFIFKSHLLGIPLGKTLSLSKTFLASEEFAKKLETSQSDDSDRELMESILKIQEHLAEDDPESIDQALYSEDDLVWFLPLVTLSLFTYIEVYSGKLIDKLVQCPAIETELTSHLIKYSDEREDRSRPPISTIREMGRISVKNRLIQTETGLSLDKVIHGVLVKTSLDKHRDRWKKFIDLRNDAAHRDPRIELPKAIIQAIEEALPDAENEILDMKAVKNIGPTFTRVVEEVQKQTTAAQHRFQKVTMMFTMALVYPALIDTVIAELE